MLQKLHSLFVNNALLNTVDNVCGAIARLITTNPASVPLNQVLPSFFTALPLKVDHSENKAVFNCIFFLFSTQTELVSLSFPRPQTVTTCGTLFVDLNKTPSFLFQMFSNLPRLFSIFAAVLGEPDTQLVAPTRVGLLSLIQSVSAQRNDLFTQAVASLSEYERSVLAKAITQ